MFIVNPQASSWLLYGASRRWLEQQEAIATNAHVFLPDRPIIHFCFCLPRHWQTCLKGCRCLGWTHIFSRDGLNHLATSRRPSLMKERLNRSASYLAMLRLPNFMNEQAASEGLPLAAPACNGLCFGNNQVNVWVFLIRSKRSTEESRRLRQGEEGTFG